MADSSKLDRSAPLIPVGISSCLLGEKVRYDGGHKRDPTVTEILSKYFTFHSFCPELEIGLGVPRSPIRLTRRDGREIRCVAVDESSIDYTDSLRSCADEQGHWHQKLCGYILKAGSPSCGKERVKVWCGTASSEDGVGVYAARLMQNYPDLPVETEDSLADSGLREAFIQRVFAAWQQMQRQG